MNKIKRDKKFYKVNIESIDEKHQSLPVSPNDFQPASTVTPINETTSSIEFTLLNTKTTNHNDKDKHIMKNNDK